MAKAEMPDVLVKMMDQFKDLINLTQSHFAFKNTVQQSFLTQFDNMIDRRCCLKFYQECELRIQGLQNIFNKKISLIELESVSFTPLIER
jgi:hypothetical protein